MVRVEGTATVASSNRKKRPARVFLAAVFVIIAYFTLFPYPLHKEIVAHPAWAVAVAAAAAQPSAPDLASVAPFQLGDSFGYVAKDGTVLSSGRTLFRVTLSQSGFVNYTRLGTDWLLQDPTGRRLTSFSGVGYPLLSPDGSRLFNVKTDLSGIMELDKNGGVLWDRDFPALITSASISADSLLVGLLNGTLVLLNREGSPVFTRSLKGSRIGVVMGAAIAPNGSMIAGVSGIDPQYLTVLRRREAGFEQVAARPLRSDFRREVRLAFSPDSRFLAFEDASGGGLFDPAGGAISTVTLPGELAGLAFPAHGRCAAFLARSSEGNAELAIVAPFSAPLYREEFPSADVFLGSVDGQLLMGWNGRLLRIDIEEL